MALAHDNWSKHYDDIATILGLQKNEKLKDWAKFISSDMIDQVQPFYSQLQERHPGFKCKHRCLFHWGYNAKPMSQALERKIENYCMNCKSKKVSSYDTIDLFLEELRTEQKRRNRKIKDKTESTFGFYDGGEEGRLANFFASMAYNIHLIGDYTSDNTDLDGLQDFDNIIGLLIVDLRYFDNIECKEIVKKISIINKQNSDCQTKADNLMSYLKQSIPEFIRKGRKGMVYRRLKRMGY